MTTIKTLKGYTTQARYYAEHMLNDATGDSFVTLGWTMVRLDGYKHATPKPVYQTLNGQRVVLLDGHDHLTVLVTEIDADADIRPSDLDFYPYLNQPVSVEGGR